MIIDCDRCTARGPACGGCVVTMLLGGPPTADAAVEPTDSPWHLPAGAVGLDAAEASSVRADGRIVLDEAERAAVAILAQAGLVPPVNQLQSYAISQRLVAARDEMVG